MGNCCLPIRFRRTSSAINPKNVTLLLLGLDNSGKTTIAKRLAGEPIDSVVPTVGFSVVLLRQKGCHVSIYDLGGGPQIRDIWPRYYADAHGIIFVTDAQDTQRMEECRAVLEGILQNGQVSGKPVLLLANKQDLDGALDEIDVVDRLNLEKLVNEQKCPTLVELCSALYFSKKMDVGIDNGYKWLIRSIIREYPSLNNRVLKDLAKQEEENRVQVIRRQSGRAKRENGNEETIIGYVEENPYIAPFKPLRKILDEKNHPNGIAKPPLSNTVARIPGLVDDIPEKLKEKKNHIHRFLGEEILSVPQSSRNSYSSEFFIFESFQSDMDLLNDVPNQTFKNFLTRPKSSGARLYGARPDRKKTQRRKPLRRTNKTGPSPFSDISVENDASTHPERKSSEGNDTRNPPKNPFVVPSHPKSRLNERLVLGESKSTPNSRRGSIRVGKKRRHSMANGRPAGGLPAIELSPLKLSNRVPTNSEVLLDVTRLGD